jgi:hypothetical protein
MAVYDILPNEDLKDVDVVATLNANGGTVDFEQESWYKTSTNINKWAKFKPQNSDNLFKLSEEERKLGNYGLDLTWSGSARTPQSVLIDMAQGKDFYPYVTLKPPYRMSDYLGYNPKAPAPYSLDCSSTLEVLSFPASIPFTIKINSKAEFKLTDLAGFEDSFSGGYFAVLCGEGLNANSKVIMHKPSDPEQYYNMLYGEIEVTKAGTYYLAAVYTNIPNVGKVTDVSSVAENFMPIPEGYISVKVTQKTVYAYAEIRDFVQYGNLYYNNNSKSISVFGSPIYIDIYKPSAVLSSTYNLSLYFRLETNNGTLEKEWVYEDEDIHVTAGTSLQTVTLVNFPSNINLPDIIPELQDNSFIVYSMTIYLNLQKIDGQGLLGFEETHKYDVIIEA